MTPPPPPPPRTPEPRSAVVTGSSGGVGLAVAQALARSGWRVLVHGRDSEKLARARASLGPDGGHGLVRADLSNSDGTLRLASAVRAWSGRLDVLVHNAGLLMPTLRLTDDDIETTLAVNALAPFVLTNALRPLLEATVRDHGGARVVTVTSEAHRGGRIPTTDPDALADVLRRPPGRYLSIRAYAQSKIVATAWTIELARRLEGTGVTANACHPGLVRTGVSSGFGPLLGPVLSLFSPLYLPPAVGAQSPLLLATAPQYGERTGRFVTRSHLRGPHEARPPAQARDPAVGAAVWDALGRLAESSSP